MLTPKYIQTSEHYEALAEHRAAPCLVLARLRHTENHFDCINQESHTKYCFVISHFCHFIEKQACKSMQCRYMGDLADIYTYANCF